MLKRRRMNNQTGFSAIESLLVLVIVLLIGFIGYYVWHAQKETNKTLDSASHIAQDRPAVAKIDSFDACKKAAGSKLLETFPEQCVTKDGKNFTQPVPPGPYAGWRQYCSKIVQACFKYPPSWIFAECAPKAVNWQYFQDCDPAEGVIVLPPDDSLRVGLGDGLVDDTDCGPGTTKYTYSDVTPVPGANNLEYVYIAGEYENFQALLDKTNGLMPVYSGSNGACGSQWSFKSRDNKYWIDFNMGADPDQDLSKASTATVKKILTSFTWQ